MCLVIPKILLLKAVNNLSRPFSQRLKNELTKIRTVQVMLNIGGSQQINLLLQFYIEWSENCYYNNMKNSCILEYIELDGKQLVSESSLSFDFRKVLQLQQYGYRFEGFWFSFFYWSLCRKTEEPGGKHFVAFPPEQKVLQTLWRCSLFQSV